LERKNPAEFERRAPNALNAQQFAELFATVASPFVETMSDKDFDAAMQRLDEFSRQALLKPKEKEADALPDAPAAGGYGSREQLTTEREFFVTPQRRVTRFARWRSAARRYYQWRSVLSI
jgi:hypothetical protein